MPAYRAEGKTRLTIAIGCTGGFHRSVAISDAVAEDLRDPRTWGPWGSGTGSWRAHEHARLRPAGAAASGAGCGPAPASAAGCWWSSSASCCWPSRAPSPSAILFRDVPADSLAGQLFELVSLQYLPGLLRPLIVLLVGAGIIVYGLRRLMGVLLEPFPARSEPLVELVYQKRSLARGPRVVAIGGGTGLSTLLRGLKEVTSNITAVVTVADDGGSSGQAARGAGHRARGRHPQLHHGARGRGADDDPAAPVPLPRGRGRRRRAWRGTRSATC